MSAATYPVLSESPIVIQLHKESGLDPLDVAPEALHEAVEIKYFCEGTSVLLIGNQPVSAQAGDIVVINPYEFHTTIDCGRQQGTYHVYMLPLDLFAAFGGEGPDLRSLLLVNCCAFQTLIRDDPQITQLLQRLAEEHTTKHTAYQASIRALMMETAILLVRRYLCEETVPIPKEDGLHAYRLIEPALGYIRDHFSSTVSLDQLAGICGMSKHHFCRIFKSVTGKTAMSYIRDYRIQVSDILLTQTDHSIAQIAELCGFESTHYYCRCYKAVCGCTPGAKRKIS